MPIAIATTITVFSQCCHQPRLMEGSRGLLDADAPHAALLNDVVQLELSDFIDTCAGI